MGVRKIAKPRSSTSSIRKASRSASEDHETEAELPSLRENTRALADIEWPSPPRTSGYGTKQTISVARREVGY
jgi:hypothetical protein